MKENTFVKALEVVGTDYNLGKARFINKRFRKASIWASVSKRRINKRSIKNKASAEFALAFVNNSEIDLSKLSAVDLSEIIRDLREAARYKNNPKHDLYLEALEKIHNLSLMKLKRHYADKKSEKISLYDAEAFQLIIKDYVKNNNLDEKQKKEIWWLNRNLKKDLRFYNPQKEEDKKTVIIEQSKDEIPPLPDTALQHKIKKPQQNTADILEKVCKQRRLKFVRVDEDNDPNIIYNLYGCNKEKRDKITGSLTIHNEKEMTLNSNDLKHFIVMAETARQNGSNVLKVGHLSLNEKKAKDFAAKLVLAGAIVGIKVEQPYALEELKDYHPKISLLIEKQQLRQQMNDAREKWKAAKASGDEKIIREAEANLQNTMFDSLQKYINEESLGNKKTPEHKKEAAEKALAKTLKNNSQAAINKAVLERLQKTK